MSSRILKIVIPIAVLVAGIAAAAVITSARKAPPRVDRPPLGPLVEVLETQIEDVPVVVSGHGEVVPKVSVDVVPQVAGQVVELHPSFVAGGFFKRGDVLVVIDPRDYELALQRAEADVARAGVSLEQERAEAAVAREEWDDLHAGEEPTDLVVREPQIRQAEAELVAAEANLEAARLNLERTRVTLPFDGVVVSKDVDVGQFVAVGSRLATVYGTDVVEVTVPLESRELAWFDVPSKAGGKGSAAEVSASFGGTVTRWQGHVTRMEAEVDELSRMVHVVIEVPKPYEASAGRPPLFPGSFVDVRIEGRTLHDVVTIPRHAVRDGGRVWVFDEGALRFRDVEVVRADRERSVISSGLEEGDMVIISSLDAVTDGMAVRDAAGGENDGQPSEQVEAAEDGTAARRHGGLGQQDFADRIPQSAGEPT